MDSTPGQILRYALVGVGSNLLLYLGYLLLTAIGVGPKTAMTFMYSTGILITFLLNRQWTFQHTGLASHALLRHVIAYALFYGVNFFGLWLFVDRIGWPHQGVQAALIVLCAAGLFLTMKFWVFSARPTGASTA